MFSGKMTSKKFGARFLLVWSAAMLMMSACAPEQAERLYAEPKSQFGPLQQDADLGLEGPRQLSVVDSSEISWQGEVDSAAVFQAAEGLMEFGALRESPRVAALGERLGDAFYSANGTSTRVTLEESPYISAAIGETKADALASASENDQMLERQAALVTRILDETSSRYPWPKGAVAPEYLIDSARIYTEVFLDELGRRPVDPRVRVAIREAVQEKVFDRLNEVRADAAAVLAQTDGIVLIQRVRSLLPKYGVKLDGATNSKLEKVEKTLRATQKIDGPQSALSVIVDLWLLTEPAERAATFKPMSAELYDFLKDLNSTDLACLRAPDCSNLIAIVIKRVKILPSIREYGISKLRRDILTAVRSAVIEEIETRAAAMLPSIPRLMAENVVAEVGSFRSFLKSIETNFDGFVRGVAARAADSLLASPLGVEMNAVESSRVQVDLRGGQNLSISAIRSNTRSDVFETGAETIGASFAFAAKKLTRSDADRDVPAFRKKVLEQINKMLAIGGFHDGKGIPFPSFARAIDPTKNLRLDLRKFLDGDESFAVPDRIAVSDSFSQGAVRDFKVSGRAQAEMLHGLSSLITFFRDWQANGFDRHLGAVVVDNFVPQVPKGSIGQSLFPKDVIFSLTVGNAAVILQNLTRKLSPVFLINLERRAVWANEFDLSQGNPATMAALVDINKGQRGDSVRSADVARFLLSVLDFLRATEGIEKTRASALTVVGADGQRPIDTLIHSRDRLRLLIVGLANFLSHQMQDKDGGIRSRFNRTSGQTQTDESRTLADQAVAIRALLEAGQFLDMDIYRWAALDAYAFMNRTLFSHKFGFYRASEEGDAPADLPSMVATLIAGEALKPQMSEKSRLQWERIASAWTSALERF